LLTELVIIDLRPNFLENILQLPQFLLERAQFVLDSFCELFGGGCNQRILQTFWILIPHPFVVGLLFGSLVAPS
jgi:hypothetical protein